MPVESANDFPAIQSVHILLPVVPEYLPLPQTPQEVDPREEAKVPITHGGPEAIAPVPAVPNAH